MTVLDVHLHLSQNGKIPRRIKETSKAFKLHRHTVERIIKIGFAQKNIRGENLKHASNYLKLTLTGRASFVRRFMVFIVKNVRQNWTVFLRSESKLLEAQIINFVTNVYYYIRNLDSHIRNVINVPLSWKV